jgi:hypothetical protein
LLSVNWISNEAINSINWHVVEGKVELCIYDDSMIPFFVWGKDGYKKRKKQQTKGRKPKTNMSWNLFINNKIEVIIIATYVFAKTSTWPRAELTWVRSGGVETHLWMSLLKVFCTSISGRDNPSNLKYKTLIETSYFMTNVECCKYFRACYA